GDPADVGLVVGPADRSVAIGSPPVGNPPGFGLAASRAQLLPDLDVSVAAPGARGRGARHAADPRRGCLDPAESVDLALVPAEIERRRELRNDRVLLELDPRSPPAQVGSGR